jgi:penicillin amidase
VNLAIIGLETATTVEEALDVARLSGVPAQNFHVVDEQGRIAWTILGRLPKRVGCDGRRPASWADGSCRWDGLLPPEEVPRILDPESGRLWSANNRTVGGEAFALLGDGGYRIGARAGQIRDDLFALEAATPRDLLAIQLDDRALFYQRWGQLLLSVLTPEALEGHPDRRELRRLVETWDGRAAVDSAAYRLVRAFRIDTAAEVLPPLLRAATEADPEFTYRDLIDQAEGPLWRLVSERPPHLLNPRFADWDELFLAAADEFLDYYADLGDGLPLAQRTWGQINQSYIRHVMSDHLPFFASGWLDMPSEAMAGDYRMPRVHLWDTGATLRMVVSPGREEEGFFTMPVGQSGHPMSPHYGDSHGAWSRGEAAPFLPGPAVHTLTLHPAGS